MAFFVDDRFYSHRKVMRAAGSPHYASAIALWVLAGSWAAGQLAERHTGRVPLYVLGSFHMPEHEKAVALLLEVGLLERVEEDTVQFHDWATWNGVDAKANREAEANRRSSAAYRLRRCEKGEHGKDCPPKTCPKKQAKTAAAGHPRDNA